MSDYRAAVGYATGSVIHGTGGWVMQVDQTPVQVHAAFAAAESDELVEFTYRGVSQYAAKMGVTAIAMAWVVREDTA